MTDDYVRGWRDGVAQATRDDLQFIKVHRLPIGWRWEVYGVDGWALTRRTAIRRLTSAYPDDEDVASAIDMIRAGAPSVNYDTREPVAP